MEKEHRQARKGCVTKDLAHEAFGHLDTNHNGSLSYDEIKAGLEELAASQNHTITDDEWKWIEATGAKIDKKTPGKVDEKEFHRFANAIFRHFDLCHLAEEAEAKQAARAAPATAALAQADCLTKDETNEGFEYVDTNHNGSLSYAEIKVGLQQLAKHHDYTPTDADWAWVESTGKRIDSATPGVVDQAEFYTFANAVANHFHICPGQ